MSTAEEEAKILASMSHSVSYEQEALEQEKYDVCAELNLKFHRLYVNICENKALTRALRPVVKTVTWFWMYQIYYKNHDSIPLSINDHKMIIEAFLSYDSTKAEAKVRKHILRSLEILLKLSMFDSNGNYVLPWVVEKNKCLLLRKEGIWQQM